MRFFKYSIILSGGFTIVFLLTGFVQPVVNYEASVIVPANQSQTFRLFTDSSLTHKWLSGLEKIESAHAHLYRKGNINTMYLSGHGSSYEIIQTIRYVHKNKRLLFNLVSKSYINKVNVHFIPLSNSTQVKIRGAIQGKNKIWQSIFFYTRHWHHKRLERDLQNFAQLVKNSSAN